MWVYVLRKQPGRGTAACLTTQRMDDGWDGGGGDTMVDVGSEAPDFALRGANGDEMRLSALRGKKRALLIFYPTDMTSG